MPSESAIETIDVAIIGAGWYGLKAARTYLDLESSTKLVVFDGDSSVGGVWSKKRIYPNLVAQVGFGYFNYPGSPMSKEGQPANHLVSGNMIQGYLENFAVESGIMPHIRFNSWVENVDRCPRGWRLRVNGRFIESAKLIVACGVTSVPNEYPFKVEQAPVSHSRDIAANLPVLKSAQSIVVVGAAKSAYDAVYLLCSLGKRVTWVIRPDGSGPMPIMPHEIFGLNTITVGSTRLMSYLSPSMFNTQTMLGSFFHRTILGRWLTKTHWNFITSMSEKAAGFGGPRAIDSLKPDMHELSCFWCDSSLGLITVTDFWNTLQKGDLTVVRDNVEVARAGSVLLRSGEAIECDHVLSATGWGDHFSFFSPELKEELGIPVYGTAPATDAKCDSFWEAHDRVAEASVSTSIPLLGTGPKNYKWHPDRKPTKRRWRLYNRCIPLDCARTGDRSIVILGQIHTTQTPTIAGIQSLWAIAYMLGDINLPEEKVMVKEISEYLAWTRMRYSSVGERYPYALFDWIGYLDRLLVDLGLKSRRKGNLISEYLSPYGPESYAGCLNDYLSRRKGLPRKSSA